MKAFLLLAALSCCAIAQDTPQPAVLTVLHDPTGSATLRMRNSAKVSLTGFSYVYTFHRSPTDTNTYGASTGYYDSLTDPGMAQAVEPGAEVTLPIRIGGNGMYVKVSLAAAIWADGASQGEKGMVQKLQQRRGYMSMALNKSIGELVQASKEAAPRDQIAAQFQMAMSQEMGAGLDPDLIGCIQNVRGAVIGRLRSARQPDGSVQPTEELIQSILQDLRTRRDALKM